MSGSKIVIANVIFLSVVVLIFIYQRPVQTQGQPTPMATRDAATTGLGDQLNAPTSAMLIATQGSSSVTPFRAQTLIGCDKFVSKNLKVTAGATGTFGLAGAAGKSVYVCSYSISNANVAQDVQFVDGTEASSGSGSVCNPGNPVSAKFHLTPNQFISQGSGVGSLFRTVGEGLCLRIFATGEVGINVTYATF